MRLALAFCASLIATPLWADAIESFPYRLVETTGTKALAEWQRLRAEPGTPIILGNHDDLERIATTLNPNSGYGLPQPEEVLESASDLFHPGALYAMREVEWRDFRAWAQEEGLDDLVEELGDSFPPPLRPGELGDWDDAAPKQTAPASTHDYDGAPHDTVYIAILPTENAYEAPAYLLFGGWNANPMPDVHVSVLESWWDRYGAVPVVITGDVIEMHVDRPPTTQEAAMELAYEQFLYANDIVHQGVGSVSALGSMLLDSPFWYFWWD